MTQGILSVVTKFSCRPFTGWSRICSTQIMQMSHFHGWNHMHI